MGFSDQMPVGEIARLAGVSTRTIRYYEELALLPPTLRSAGGARRYGRGDLERITRIRELQDLLGFNLAEIGEILKGEGLLADMRAELDAGVSIDRRREMIDEAIGINTRLQSLVRAKQERLGAMMDDLEVKAGRYALRALSLAEEAASTVQDTPERTRGVGR